MTLLWVALAFGAGGAVAGWLGYRLGQRSEDAAWIERMKSARADSFAAGQRAERANIQMVAEDAEAARQAQMTENRRNGQLARHAKAQRAARGES